MTATDADRQRSQRLLVLAAGIAGVLVAGLVLGIYLLMRDPETQTAAPAQPKASVTESPKSQPDITWAKTAGVDLPVSRAHGPRTVTAAMASGFSDSELGAAIAAVHVLIRSSAAAGPAVFEPTITQQVAGANAAAMKLLVAQQYEQLRRDKGAAEGEPIAGDAEVLGYRVGAYDGRGGSAVIQVFLTSPELSAKGQRLRFDVRLQRADDDWRVIAPPRGDWGAVTTALSGSPDGLISYGGQR